MAHGESKGPQTGDGVRPVRIVRAERPIDVCDQSLMEWEKEKTLLSGFTAPAPYVPFGDVHLAWRPEGFYLFSLSDTYVDPNFLDYKDGFPQSESFQLHFTVEAKGKRNHLAVYLIAQNNPSYPDGFEIKPELFRLRKRRSRARAALRGARAKDRKISAPHGRRSILPGTMVRTRRVEARHAPQCQHRSCELFSRVCDDLGGKTRNEQISDPQVFTEIVLE